MLEKDIMNDAVQHDWESSFTEGSTASRYAIAQIKKLQNYCSPNTVQHHMLKGMNFIGLISSTLGMNLLSVEVEHANPSQSDVGDEHRHH